MPSKENNALFELFIDFKLDFSRMVMFFFITEKENKHFIEISFKKNRKKIFLLFFVSKKVLK